MRYGIACVAFKEKVLKNRVSVFYLYTVAIVIIMLAMISMPGKTPAFDWATTELQYQYGRLEAPGFAGGGSAGTHIITFQHASGWKFGDNFFFIDFLNDSTNNGFNDTDFYGELYLNFSPAKISGHPLAFGPIKDIGLLGGINFASDSNVIKFLPGIRFSWDFPGFAFLNTDITAYIDHSSGASSGGAPKEDNSFMVDVNWAYPFQIGSHSYSVEGHIEYIGKRNNEFGSEVSEWILGQPQFRYDLGNALFKNPNKLFVGIEWQFWINKLGDRNTDENTVQALIVWRL